MKKSIFMLLAIFVATALNAQENQKPKIEFETTTINLGRFGQENAVHHCQFIFKNTGGEKLYIHQVIPTCSCTSQRFPKNAIAPGASDTIFITYDGTGKAPRKFRTSITIHSNAINEMTKVYIKGEILPAKVVDVEDIQVEE